jgi:uncharacterized protein
VGRRAVDLARRLNGDRPCGLIFFGGEPLLQKDLMREVVDYARHLERAGAPPFHFKITTNGLLLDEEFLEFAGREDLLIALSCDGDRDVHDRHRRRPDGSPSFDLVRARLAALLAARPYSSVIMVVNPDTAAQLDESAAYLVEAGCRYLIMALNYAADWSEPSLADTEAAYRRLAGRYVEWTRAGRKFYLSPFEVKLSSHINAHCFDRERCDLGRRQLSVDPEGYVFPCVQFPRAGKGSRWCVGHVDRGLDEAARDALWREATAEKDPCGRCDLQRRCSHTCSCLNWQTTGATNRVSPVLCRHERLLTELADEIGRTLYGERNALFLHKHYNAGYPVLSLLEDALGSP